MDDPSWTTTGNLGTARYRHTATLLPSGKVLVAGGTDNGMDAFNSAELYDSATGLWTASGSLAKARYGRTAMLLPSGQVLVAGGSGDNTGQPLKGLSLPTVSPANPSSYLGQLQLPHHERLPSNPVHKTIANNQ